MATQNITLSHIINVEEIKLDFSTFILLIKERRQVLFPSTIYTKERLLFIPPAVINVSSAAAQAGCMGLASGSSTPDGISNVLLIGMAWHRCNRHCVQTTDSGSHTLVLPALLTQAQAHLPHALAQRHFTEVK